MEDTTMEKEKDFKNPQYYENRELSLIIVY